jgi:hypothetical protein
MVNRILFVISICSCIVAFGSFVLGIIEIPPLITGEAALSLSTISYILSLVLFIMALRFSRDSISTKPPLAVSVSSALILGIVALAWVIVSVGFVRSAGYGNPVLGEHSIFHHRDEYHFRNHGKDIVTDRDTFVSLALGHFLFSLTVSIIASMFTIFTIYYRWWPFMGSIETGGDESETAAQTTSSGG